MALSRDGRYIRVVSIRPVMRTLRSFPASLSNLLFGGRVAAYRKRCDKLEFPVKEIPPRSGPSYNIDFNTGVHDQDSCKSWYLVDGGHAKVPVQASCPIWIVRRSTRPQANHEVIPILPRRHYASQSGVNTCYLICCFENMPASYTRKFNCSNTYTISITETISIIVWIAGSYQ
jgi:hypothetical protein